MKRLFLKVLVMSLALLLPVVASALTSMPNIMLDLGEGAVMMNGFGTLTDTGEHTASWMLTEPTPMGGVMINNWTVQLDEDPFVTNNINVTNTTAFTQTFVATVVLTIPAFSYDQVVNSSMGVTTTDSNSNNVLSFANSGSTPIYQGQVNGTTLLPLTPLNLPLTTADCGGAGCTAVDNAFVSSLAVTPGVATTIGLVLTFDLSPGDSAGLTSRFEIIPEPGTIALLATGLGGLALLGRRRQ